MKNYYEEDQKLFQAVAGFKAGNQECYYTMYELSIKYIYKIVYDIIKEHHATEDLVQETYLTIYNKIDSLEDVSKFYSWAGRIATNHTFRYIQKNKRELLTLDSEDGAAEFAFEVATQDNEEFIPENVLMDKEKQRLIAQIIDGLSTEQKLAVQYFYYEEMSVTEIAETMGCARGTIMSRLNYARKAIKAAVVDLAENQGTKLYSLGSLPLFYIVFRSSLESFAVASAASVSGILSEVGSATESAITKGTTAMETAETAGSAGGAVSTTAGTEAVAGAGATTGAGAVGGSVAGAGSAAGVGAGTTVGAGAVAKAAAAGATKGILGKIGASLGAKIAAGVLTAGLLTTGGIMLHNAVTGDDTEKRDTKITVENESSVIVENEESKSEEGTTQEVILEISEVGQIIEFGHYEQDGDVSNGTEPIEWEVLSVEDGRALLISKYVLDAIPFSSTSEHKIWEDSTLRMWLNDAFLNAAFTEDEQKIIPTVTLTNPGNEYSRLEATADTQDRVFALSVEEIFRYYEFEYFDEEWNYVSSEELVIEPTEYAIAQGVTFEFISEEFYEIMEFKGWSRDILGKKMADWWLRTPSISTTVCVVSQGNAGEGCYDSNYEGGRQNTCIGVRPALYVNVITDSGENEEPGDKIAENGEEEIWADDYVITITDERMLERVREVTGITEGDITYGDVKDITEFEIPEGASNATCLKYFTGLVKLSCGVCSELEIDIDNLNNLTDLQLVGVNFTTLQEIENLTNLTNLDLECSNLTTLKGIGNLTNLTSLRLVCPGLTTLEGMEPLPNVTFLALWCDNLTTLEGIENVSNVTFLFLRCTNLPTLENITVLSNLTEVDLWYCNGLTTLKEIGSLTNLTILKLGCCDNLTSLEGIGFLPNLVELWIQGCTNMETLEGIDNPYNQTILFVQNCEKISEDEISAFYSGEYVIE